MRAALATPVINTQHFEYKTRVDVFADRKLNIERCFTHRNGVNVPTNISIRELTWHILHKLSVCMAYM